MILKQTIRKITLILSIVFLCIPPAFSADGNSVDVSFNDETELWNATFYNINGNTFKTLEYKGTVIDAINKFLLEAGDNAQIDILSPGIYTVITEDAVGGIVPLSGQTIDFHNNEISILNPSGVRMNGIHAVRANNVTIRNFRLSGHFTYGIWTQGCDNLTIDNLDIDMVPESGIALFIRPRGSSRPRNLIIKGEVYINGGTGHAIEFKSVDGVTIGDVTVSNNSVGCGINASGSTNIKIGNVYGYKNCYFFEGDGGGYATLRYSNAGKHLDCKGIYSRRCGRGYMITQGNYSALPNVLGQHFSTVEIVDIRHTVKENIFIRGTYPTNNKVLSGTISESIYQSENLVFLEGETNSVLLGIPELLIDTTKIKTARINELRFGFYDLTGDRNSENYFRDRNCDGFGYAKTVDKVDAFMEWNVKSGNGNHRFTWQYASQNAKKAKLLLNNKYIESFEFPETGADSIWQSFTLNVYGLEASEIKNIKLVSTTNKGLPLVDYLELEAPGVSYSLKDATTATDSSNVKVETQLSFRSNTLKSNKSIHLYPNSNNGRFTIELHKELSSSCNIQIYDITGALINHRETRNENRVAVNLDASQHGLYLVKISSKSYINTYRINCL